MMPYLLFDFDGTIADSVKPLFNLLNRLAPRFGKEPVSWQEFEKIKEMELAKIAKYLKIPKLKIFMAMPTVLKEYRSIINELQLFPGIRVLLEKLSDSGVPYALLSSNRDENLTDFLQKHELHGFEWVEGTDGVLAKQRSLQRLIHRHKLNKDSLYYIGDEMRDIEAARACQIKVISVSWGLHSRELLSTAKPDFLVDEPSEIFEIIRPLNEG